MDPLGGQGNGLAWFSLPNAPITDSTQYQYFANKQIASIDIAQIKGAMDGATGSAESAPLLNYLYWLYTIKTVASS
jgi:hypothetical protein